MNRNIERIPAAILFSLLTISVCVAGDENQTDTNGIKLLTDVRASIGIAGATGGDYRFKTARQLQFDVLNFNEYFLHFKIQEIDLFDNSPAQIDHTIGYVAAGFETEDGRFSLFWDHTCNNPSRQFPENEKNTIRWNEIGVGYETTGMRFGHENTGIVFDDASEWLCKMNWRASLSRVWMRTDNDYEYMFKLGVRSDIFRIRNQVLYVQFNLDAVYDKRGANFNPLVEAGDRILLTENLFLAPFVSYERFNDWYGLDDDEEFFFYGLRLVAAVGPHNTAKNALEQGRPRKNYLLSSRQAPLRFHISGGYNTNLQGTNKSSRSSDLNLDIDILEFDDNKTLTLNTYAGILTPSGAFNVQNVNYKIGPSLKIDLKDCYLRFFHSYSCLYGYKNSGVIRNYNLLGARLGKDAHLSWNLQAGAFPSTTNFDYHALLQATTGYDFSPKGATPYINGSLVCLIGNDSVTGNAAEAGLKIPGQLGDFVVYLRQEDSFDVFRFGQGEQRWFGFRLVF